MAIHRLTASSPYISVRLISGRQSVNSIALVDTGASISAVHPDLIKVLNPPVIGQVDVTQVGARIIRTLTHYLRISLDNQTTIAVEVVAVTPSSPCQMLIGRDLMSRWLMAWDGEKDQLVISY